jgi:pimeloyl-ACP methyl ester carboxylesterase
MRLDLTMLEEHASHVDEDLGIVERFVRLQAGPAPTIGVLASPLGERQGLGWVVCHSFGSEQVDLHMTDRALARGLAAAGFPTLRFHCQGYGDSSDYSIPPRPSTQLRDILSVVAGLPALTDVDQVGVVGCRFGGTLAALAADQGGASHLLMVQPIVSGARYATELLRSRVIPNLIGRPPPGSLTVAQLRAELDRVGVVNIKGWALYRDVFGELEGVDLLRDLTACAGRALVLQVSRSATVAPGLGRLTDRLLTLGAEAELDVLTHVSAATFGYEHFRPVAKGVLGDILEGLNQGLVDRAVEWVRAEARVLEPVR